MRPIIIRDLVEFPAGDNASDTLINGVHLNLTALNHFNYTFYSNDTISNNSKCYLIRDAFKPFIHANGSWVNGTRCDIPFYAIGTRGFSGIGATVLFALSIMFTLVNLRKHGKRHLREQKRFRIVGRRWSWYWMLFVAACGMISCLTGIDVDRDYIQSTAIILQSVFYTLLFPGLLACVWEAVRHWGSFQERQIVDADPFSMPEESRRGKTTLYLPLIFYLFAWLCFFMTVPRSWTPIEKQRDEWQQNELAEPSGTDNRLKAGALLAVVAWGIICFSLYHSVKHYGPSQQGSIVARAIAAVRYVPAKLVLSIGVLAVRIGYAIASAWVWDISIFKYNVNPGLPYGLGYGSALLILLIFEIAGFVEPNEDHEILRQRRVRGAAADETLGLVSKPSWWAWTKGGHYMNDNDRLRNMGAEVQGPATRAPRDFEMDDMISPVRGLSDSTDPFSDSQAGGGRQGVQRLRSDDAVSQVTAETDATLVSDRNTSVGSSQRIQSMLFV